MNGKRRGVRIGGMGGSVVVKCKRAYCLGAVFVPLLSCVCPQESFRNFAPPNVSGRLSYLIFVSVDSQLWLWSNHIEGLE